MANEEVLRLRTTVVTDEGLTKIRQFARELGVLPDKVKPGIKGLTSDFDKFGQSIRNVGSQVVSVIPALGGMGLGAASAAVAIGLLFKTVSEAAKRIVELKYASKELGMSERDIRAWQLTAQKVGISSQSMLSGLENFKKTTDGLKYNIGGTRDALYAMGAGPIVQRVQAATTQAQKLTEVFKFGKELDKDDPSGFKKRMFYDQWGLGADKARLSLDELIKTQAKIKPIPPEEQEKAEKFNASLLELGEKWDHLTTRVGIALFPGLQKDIENVEWLLDKFDELSGKYKEFMNPGNKPTANLLPENPVLNFGFNTNAPVPRFFGLGDNPDQSMFGILQGYLHGNAPTATSPAAAPPAVSDFKAKHSLGHAPGRASGGSVFGGHPYLVGENGPELMIPGSSGSVSPGGGRSEGVKVVKEGVFQALMDFKSYIEAGGGAGGGAGSTGMLQQASFGGSAGAAAGGGVFGGGDGQGNGRGPGVGGTPNSDGQPSGGGSPASLPPQEGDITGTGPSGGRFNQPAGTPEIGKADRETVTLANGQKVTVNKRTAAQFQGFFNDLIKEGAPVQGLGGVGTRGNPSEHPGGFAVDWAQSARNVVSPATQRWISKNRGVLGELEKKWGMSGGENWRHPDTGHFSIDTLYGQKHLAQLRGEQPQVADGSATPSNSINNADGAPAGGGNPIAAERARVMKQLQEPGMRDLVAQVISHENEGEKGRADVLESLVNRAVVTGKSPRQLIYSGFYGPVNRGKITGGPAPAWALKDYDQAAAEVAAGRNVLGGRVDQGMRGEVAPGGRIQVGGEYYGWMGLKGEHKTAAARGLTDRIDGATNTAATGGTKAEGNVNVAITSNGTAAKAKATADGSLWQKTTIDNYRQMQPTNKPVSTVAPADTLSI
jgi:hypothetical protein